VDHHPSIIMIRYKGNEMKKAIALLSAVVVAACQPEVEVKISTSDIMDVANSNTTEMLQFEASIVDKFTTMDDDKKNEVKAIAAVIEKYFTDSEVDINIGSKGFEIEVEGELELTAGDDSNMNPWYFSVQKQSEGSYLVAQEKSVTWDAFSNDLKEISFMAAPKNYLPARIKLKNDGGSLTVGGAILEGTMLSGYSMTELNGDRVNLTFEGDHWKSAPLGFLYRE